MKAPGFLVVLFLVEISASIGQETFPVLTGDDVPGWKTIEVKRYPGKQLFGYMNGGAELYREFGFIELSVQTGKIEGREVQVEVFRMGSPASAFGIFSLSHGECDHVPGLCRWNCASDRYLQFVKGSYYVTVSVVSASTKRYPALVAIARVLRDGLSGEDYNPPECFRDPRLMESRFRLILAQGPLALENSYPDWSERLRGLEGFNIFLLPFPFEYGEALFSRVTFSRRDDLRQFLERIGINAPPTQGEWKVMKYAEGSLAVVVAGRATLRMIEANCRENRMRELMEMFSTGL